MASKHATFRRSITFYAGPLDTLSISHRVTVAAILFSRFRACADQRAARPIKPVAAAGLICRTLILARRPNRAVRSRAAESETEDWTMRRGKKEEKKDGYDAWLHAAQESDRAAADAQDLDHVASRAWHKSQDREWRRRETKQNETGVQRERPESRTEERDSHTKTRRRNRHTQRQRHRDTDTQTHRHTETQETQRQRQPEIVDAETSQTEACRNSKKAEQLKMESGVSRPFDARATTRLGDARILLTSYEASTFVTPTPAGPTHVTQGPGARELPPSERQASTSVSLVCGRAKWCRTAMCRGPMPWTGAV